MAKPDATLTIRHAAGLSTRGRKELAAWLLERAMGLLTEAEVYADRFTARHWRADRSKGRGKR